MLPGTAGTERFLLSTAGAVRRSFNRISDTTMKRVLADILAVIATIVAIVLTFVPGPETVLGTQAAWAASVTAIAIAVMVRVAERRTSQAAAAQDNAKKVAERGAKRAEAARARKEQEEARREKIAQQEAARAAKRAEKRAAAAVQAAAEWMGRVELATARETQAMNAMAQAEWPSVRDEAGQAAVAWRTAAGLARWAAKEVEALAQRPEVAMEARAEAQEAIQAAARARERGETWTKEQANNLAEVRDRARVEAQMAEARQEKSREAMEKAEREWRAAVASAERAEDRCKKELSRNAVKPP